jgi:hypothetical protein
MSSISGYNPSAYYQYLHNLYSSQQAAQSNSTSKSKSAQKSGGSSGGSTQRTAANPPPGSTGSLLRQIQSSVTSALQSAQSSGSGADPNQVVQSAIAQILKNHQNSSNAPPPPPPAGASETDPDGDGDTDTPGVADSDGSSSQSAFTQLLQANGVNAQQFQQDFLSAVQSAQNGGSSDAGHALASFPPGSLVDTLA